MSAAAPVQKGLEGVVAGETKLSDVDGAKCRLIYRGYSIDELVGQATYEEVSYLLLYGSLPTKPALQTWTQTLTGRRALEPSGLNAIQRLPMGDPMAMLRTAVSIMGLADPNAESEQREVWLDHAAHLIAKLPTIVATFDRLRNSRAMLGPKPTLSHAANFLYMLHGTDPSPEQAAALDAYFVLLADHGFNASTFAARTAIGTKTDLYSAVVAAIGTLKGPLHGAANRNAMEMLREIGTPEQVVPYVQKTLSDHKRFMGFGHRVYKGEDPRAKHLKRFAKALATSPTGQTGDDLNWFHISEQLQTAVWEAKKLSINVDFYSATLLNALRIPVDLFTTLFACARSAGWTAQCLEQFDDNRLIRPLALYVGPRDLTFVPLEQRHE